MNPLIDSFDNSIDTDDFNDPIYLNNLGKFTSKFLYILLCILTINTYYYIYMNLIVLLSIIISSLFFSLTDIFQNKSTKYLGPFGSSIITYCIVVLILFIIFIILYFYKKPIGPLYIPKFTNEGIQYCIYEGIFYVVALLLLGISFYYNDKSKIPINLGILTAILSTSFIFTIIIEEIVNFIQKKPLQFKLAQIIGVITIIIGIVIVALNS